MKFPQLLCYAILTDLMSCNRISNKAKEDINYGGVVVGESATEFFDGVSEGVDKTLDCEIALSKYILNKGLNKGLKKG